MNLSSEEILSGDTKLRAVSKAAALNPNAAEFIPNSFRLPSERRNAAESTGKPHLSATSGKAVLDHSESSVSNNSDDEAHQYWRHKLPDDITPDFKVMEENDSRGGYGLSLSGLSLNDGGETSRFSSSIGSTYASNDQEDSSNSTGFAKKLRYSASPHGEDSFSGSFVRFPSKTWDNQSINNHHLFRNIQNSHTYDDMLVEHAMMENSNLNPLEFLASLFPGFASNSLADVFIANGCNLGQTIERLTQLELQVDGSFNQNMTSKTSSAPSLSMMDFSPLPMSNNQNGLPKYFRDDIQRSFSHNRPSEKDNMLLLKTNPSFPSQSLVDFASVVKKAAQGRGIWKDEKNCSDAHIGTGRSSYVSASSYNSTNGSGIYGSKLPSQSSAWTTPLSLETGDVIGNMYSELREEVHDHARLWNAACFDQARQAYLIGNKALAKEFSMKGQLHNMHMKAAHGKAQESFYGERDLTGLEIQGSGRRRGNMIDLHGLHVSEAIHLLKRELSVLRSMARSMEEPLQVLIWVGMGHHTRGAHTLARLPVSVQSYLLEEEGLHYIEPQPGLLRVVIF